MKHLTIAIMSSLLLSLSTLATPGPQGPCFDNPTWKYEYALPAIRNEANFQVWFRSKEDVEAYCGKGSRGCTLKSAAEPPMPFLIIVRKPEGNPFNDRLFQCVLGHEVLHTLGQKHEDAVGVAPIRSKLFD